MFKMSKSRQSRQSPNSTRGRGRGRGRKIEKVAVFKCRSISSPWRMSGENVREEQGAFPGRVSFDLLLPNNKSQLAPLAVILHGFQGDKKHYKKLAEALRTEGWIVFVPNLSPLLGFRAATLTRLREAAIENVHKQIDWLKAKSEQHGDPLHDILDKDMIVVVGHSAGGAIALEVVKRLSGKPQGLLLLDAVPWTRTLHAASQNASHMFAHLTCSLRAPSSSLNANSAILHLLVGEQVPQELRDVEILRAKHGDFAPSLAPNGCIAACYRGLGILSTPEVQSLCLQLALEFLQAVRKGNLELFDICCSNLGPQVKTTKGPHTVHNLPSLPRFLQ